MAELTHEWQFRIGDAFPADDPLARFIVAVALAMNDNILANSLFVKAEKPYEHVYFFNLASSHLFEAAEMLRQTHREWQEVQGFVATLETEHQEDFSRVGVSVGGSSRRVARKSPKDAAELVLSLPPA